MGYLSAELIDQLDNDGKAIMESFRHGRTKKEVAGELGVSPSLITLIEQGKRKVSHKIMRRMIECESKEK